jgi:hypothetical protein
LWTRTFRGGAGATAAGGQATRVIFPQLGHFIWLAEKLGESWSR